MEKRYLSDEAITKFREHLELEEKSRSTVEKYVRDVTAFLKYCRNKEAAGAEGQCEMKHCAKSKCCLRMEVTKERVITYKHKLVADGYAVRSVNSMLGQ